MPVNYSNLSLHLWRQVWRGSPSHVTHVSKDEQSLQNWCLWTNHCELIQNIHTHTDTQTQTQKPIQLQIWVDIFQLAFTTNPNSQVPSYQRVNRWGNALEGRKRRRQWLGGGVEKTPSLHQHSSNWKGSPAISKLWYINNSKDARGRHSATSYNVAWGGVKVEIGRECVCMYMCAGEREREWHLPK